MSSAGLAESPGSTLPELVGGTRLAGTLALSLATFMGVLDISVANVAIPATAGDLGVSPDQGTWVITSFAVATAIALPLTGWLAQRIGAVRLFVVSVVLFTTLSFLCGVAPSIETLVVFRVLQGAAAGPMIPLSQVLLLRAYPPRQMGTALSALAVTTLAAPVVGPLLGGWLTDNWSWRWIYFVNVPVGMTCSLVAWRVFQPLETAILRKALDATGLALLIVWVGCLQVTLDLGRHRDWFDSPLVLGLAIASALSFILFLIRELAVDNPVVDLALFRIRNYSIGTLVLSLAYGLFLGNLVLLPLWLLQHLGYTATLAGVVLAPVGVLSIAATPLVGRYVDRFDPRVMVSGSFVVFALSLWLRSRFSTDTDLTALMLPSLVQGAGTAMFFAPILALILARVPPARVAAASGVANFLRYTAGALGTSLIVTAWDWRSALHRSRLVESTYDGNAPLTELRGVLASAGFSPQQQMAVIEQLVEQQASTLAVNDLFFSSAVSFVLLLPLLWMASGPPDR